LAFSVNWSLIDNDETRIENKTTTRFWQQ
jgi:hypothetical protein